MGRASGKRRSRSGFPIVGIGASAGGLEALEAFFKNVEPDCGIAFVVISHQHPGQTTLLPQILEKYAKFPVLLSKNGMRLEKNKIYIGPPGGYVAVIDATLQFMDGPPNEIPPHPIDFFFRSLAIDRKEQAACIVFSGTGTDGSDGLREIKSAGGLTMVQEIKSARYAGMPANAIATKMADYILPPSEMPGYLLPFENVVAGKRRTPEANEIPEKMKRPIQKLLTMLQIKLGHDFSSYKTSTIRRRIERRMQVLLIPNGDKYLRYVQENPHELSLLFKELLIGVTSFFRDNESFDALMNIIAPDLANFHSANETFRVWVPGCATGEEPYSLAILLRESMIKLNRSVPVQIFATDLDNEAIEFARRGIYPATIAAAVSPKRLARYFTVEGQTYKIRKEIREMVIFAQQNIIKDPPFTGLNLLSCRNLLIYLNSDLQKRLFPIFRYSLKPQGILMLGTSETVGTNTGIFDTIDKKWKIYRRKETLVKSVLLKMPLQKTALPIHDSSPVPVTSLVNVPPQTIQPRKKIKQTSRNFTPEKLARELRNAKESLKTTIEELETSNEELKSANEELQSTNEELQSTNEEMETSKEELQSLNEELFIVNTELQLKVDELSRTNDDMQNLLNSTEIATLFLDNGLKIKRYTEPTKKLIKLIPTDVGRPLGDLVSEMEYDGLGQDCLEVLRTLAYKETEIRTHDGSWYRVRITPYRTGDNFIGGAVVTFVDINRIKRLEKALQEARALCENCLAHKEVVPPPLANDENKDQQ